MRQLTLILTAFTVAAAQTHAGILDWLRGSPAKGSSADPVASFERGLARLQEHRNRIFLNTSGTKDISYDVKRTDSLIEPVVGIIKIVEKDAQGDVYLIDDLRLGFRDGSWVISSFTLTFLGSPIPLTPDDRQWKAIQACFVSQEAAAAAVGAMSSPLRQPDQRATANKAAAAAAAATKTSSGPVSPALSDSTATETTVPSQVEKEPAPPPGYITLNRDVEIPHGTKRIVIPKGSQLFVVSRTEHVIGVRFQGQFGIIPKSAVIESK